MVLFSSSLRVSVLTRSGDFRLGLALYQDSRGSCRYVVLRPIRMKERGRSHSPPNCIPVLLLGCGEFRRQIVGFALVPHHFESALGFFVRSRDFRLYLGRALFHLWREAHVAEVLHPGSRRDEPSDTDALLQASQARHLAADA